MIALLRPLGSILLAVIACACTQSSPQKASGSVWIGLACTTGTTEQDKLIVQAATPSNRAAGGDVCVDRAKPRMDYQPNSLRIEAYKWGGAALRLQCASSDSASQFFSQNNGKMAALVAGNRVLSMLTVSEPNMGCGWQSAADLGDAIKRCEAIAAAWQVEPESCSKLCDSKANGGVDGICISHG